MGKRAGQSAALPQKRHYIERDYGIAEGLDDPHPLKTRRTLPQFADIKDLGSHLPNRKKQKYAGVDAATVSSFDNIAPSNTRADQLP